jgi:uncharacterized protein
VLKPAATTDFTTMLKALTRPEAFPFALPAEGSVSVIQTHASAVLLAADRVYKLKKPKDFGFFDFSTPALRRHFCGQEVLVNRRLAPHVYLGVAPVVEYPGGRFRFGPTFAPGNVPLPGSMLDDGCVVDYAVVMVRLPDEAALEHRVQNGTADGSMLAEVARYVAAFHATTPTDGHIARFGALEVIRGNWEENFAQMRPYLGRTLDAATFDRIADYVHRFLAERGALFASRVRDGRIRDCHGDLRLQHIYLLDTMDNPAQRLAILDGIEFNERFRYGDVAGEVAFLTMELDGAGRPDLTHTFLERYVVETGDDALRELLPFYACYRACVRGKVQSFQLDEPEVPQTQRESARQQARLLFRQAAHYASGPIGPTLLLVGGLMGTGKSTLALALHRELGWALLSSDTTRKRLAHLDPARPQAQAFGQGVYNAAWTARTYDALIEKAGEALAAGRSVLLDASFLRRSDRQAAARLAAAYEARLLFVECACPREVALQRLAKRWQSRTEGIQEPGETASRASDGRPDLYDAQQRAWEPFDPGPEPDTGHIETATTLPLAATVEGVLEALGVPHFVCWL